MTRSGQGPVRRADRIALFSPPLPNADGVPAVTGRGPAPLPPRGPGAVRSPPRRPPGKPDQPETLVGKGEVMDPLTFVLRMRLAPPRTAQVFEVLDGHGLWLLTVAPAIPVSGDFGKALRLDGKADPVFWDGSHD